MSTARRRGCALAATLGAGLVIAACSPGTTPGDDDTLSGTTTTTVTFRLWDNGAVHAYQESFDAFSARHPDIRVEVERVPWSEYWTRLDQDLRAGTMADIFWMNTAQAARYIDQEALTDLSGVVEEEREEWEPAVTELYERDDALWGVPQLWDSIALYYNAELVEEAGVEPDELVWQPPEDEDADAGEDDTLVEAARELTTDTAGRHPNEDGFNTDTARTYGFNAQADPQAIYLGFLAQNGGVWQEEERFAFATEEGVEAFQYLVDLVDVHQVAPPAAATNQDADQSLELFVDGELALYQSGPYQLTTIAEDADFEWGIAPLVAGPEGRVSVVHAVAAVANAESEETAATEEVLRWLGSADGQRALANQGVAFPAATSAQDTYVDYWREREVDVTPFVDAVRGETTPSPRGLGVHAGMRAMRPWLHDMFLGDIPVDEALERAQDAGNEALEE